MFGIVHTHKKPWPILIIGCIGDTVAASLTMVLKFNSAIANGLSSGVLTRHLVFGLQLAVQAEMGRFCPSWWRRLEAYGRWGQRLHEQCRYVWCTVEAAVSCQPIELIATKEPN